MAVVQCSMFFYASRSEMSKESNKSPKWSQNYINKKKKNKCSLHLPNSHLSL